MQEYPRQSQDLHAGAACNGSSQLFDGVSGHQVLILGPAHAWPMEGSMPKQDLLYNQSVTAQRHMAHQDSDCVGWPMAHAVAGGTD